METWLVREAFLYFCLFVDADAPTWRAWLGYQNSSDGEDFKAPQRNADAYLKLLDRCQDEITERVVEQLANCSKQPSGTGGKRLWERAKRFFELKRQFQCDGENALTLIIRFSTQASGMSTNRLTPKQQKRYGTNFV